MEIEFKRVKLHEAKDDLLEIYLDFQERVHESEMHDSVLRSRTYRRNQLKITPMKNQYQTRILGLRDDQVICSAIAGFQVREQETNEDLIWMDITVLPTYRREGLGSKLLSMLIEYAKQYDKTRIECGFYPIDTPASEIWINKLGLKHGFTEKVSRLYKQKINWEFIQKAKKKYGDLTQRFSFMSMTRAEWAIRILEDDDFAERMADFFTEADNLLPREDKKWNDVVITVNDLKLRAEKNLETKDQWENINYYAFDEEKIIAISETYFPRDPPLRDVGTGLTAVREDYQRQGLATYLKILITEYYVNNYPNFEYIFTENAGSNEGMLHINYSLGYETVYEWSLYQGEIELVESELVS